MTDNQIEQELQAKGLTAPRVTPADIEASIASEDYFTAFDGIAGSAFNAACPDGLLRPFTFNAGGSHACVTICLLILHSGWKVVGVNEGPVSPENFDQFIGRKLARQKAVDQIWLMLGYALHERLHSVGARLEYQGTTAITYQQE